MGRFKGTFEVPANYEPQKAAPFDARQLVNEKADLIKASTWQDSKGDMWIYSGMIVSVCSDSEANNRVYRLLDASHYSEEKYWTSLVELPELLSIQTNLQNQIDKIISTGGNGDPVLKEQIDQLKSQVTTLDNLVNDELVGIIAQQEQLDKVKEDINTIFTQLAFHNAILEGIGGEGEPKTILEAIASISLQIPVASEDNLGGIKLSAEIGLNNNHQVEIKALSTDKLIQGEKELILNGGTS